MTNKDRATKAADALIWAAGGLEAGEVKTPLIRLYADFRHLCGQEQIDYVEVIAQSNSLYYDEVKEKEHGKADK